MTAGLNESESLNSRKSLLTFGDSRSMVYCLTQLITGSETLFIYVHCPLGNTCRRLFTIVLICLAYCQHRTVGEQGMVQWRALASHQCGPGSNPGVDAKCGLILLLVLSFDPRGFSPSTPVSPLLKNQHFQIPIRPGIRLTKNHFVDALPPNHYLFCLLLVLQSDFFFS